VCACAALHVSRTMCDIDSISFSDNSNVVMTTAASKNNIKNTMMSGSSAVPLGDHKGRDVIDAKLDRFADDLDGQLIIIIIVIIIIRPPVRGVDPYGTGGTRPPPNIWTGGIIRNVSLNISRVISATFYPCNIFLIS